jgi:hypothetical protein
VSGWRVEVVRGRLDEATSERLIAFWTSQGALDEVAARERLHQVVCVLYDSDGEVAGVNSAYEAIAPLVGRRFWIYRRFVPPGVGHDAELAMIGAAFDELARGREGAGPVGLCVTITDRELMAARPEAIWPDVDLTFAGYSDQGAQIRIRYFDGAMI